MGKTKEETLNELHNTMTNISETLVRAGIQQEQITRWCYAATKMQEIQAQIRWIKTFLLPAMKHFNRVYGERTPAAWNHLAMIAPRHKDFKVLDRHGAVVRRVWKNKPRYIL